MSNNKKSIFEYNDIESTAAFRKCFEKLAYRVDYSRVFSDFVDFSLLMLNINKKAEDFKELETRWDNPEDHKLFAEMFALLGNLSEGFNDALGDLFMECVSHGRNGQFFTPQPICDMMAIMTIGDQAKDGMSVSDCACGSGRMLLGAAKINRHLKFYGADNDATCAKMTAVNFILHSMTGEVAHMNTLSMEHYKSWHIRKILSGTHYLPYYYVTGPNETTFIQRIKATQSQEPKQEIVTTTNHAVHEVKASKHGQLVLF